MRGRCWLAAPVGEQPDQLSNTSLDPIIARVEHLVRSAPRIDDCARGDGLRIQITEDDDVHLVLGGPPKHARLLGRHHND